MIRSIDVLNLLPLAMTNPATVSTLLSTPCQALLSIPKFLKETPFLLYNVSPSTINKNNTKLGTDFYNSLKLNWTDNCKITFKITLDK